MNHTDDKEKEDIKESFCPVCIAAIPLAFSVSTGVGAAYEDEEYIQERKKTIMIWSVVIGVISLIIMIYYLFIRKCMECA